MKTLGSAIKLLLCLPPVWLAILAIGTAFAFNGWEPFVDIAAYAVQRLLAG
jgi:hypothetical protein